MSIAELCAKRDRYIELSEFYLEHAGTAGQQAIEAANGPTPQVYIFERASRFAIISQAYSQAALAINAQLQDL
ncbi:hypothetical protein [Plantactinospora sonchi]|uniref:Uncharacterized protein n=1 Tax=Plantactinospora sonchi TaxID=1544735 RepID=A0ABU7RWS1_9ACTN